jgi:hypothetical protein
MSGVAAMITTQFPKDARFAPGMQIGYLWEKSEKGKVDKRKDWTR